MKLDGYAEGGSLIFRELTCEPAEMIRAEVAQEADDGQVFTIILLDADDSFDVAVKYPNGEREIVWSLVRERRP